MINQTIVTKLVIIKIFNIILCCIHMHVRMYVRTYMYAHIYYVCMYVCMYTYSLLRM